jgi:hypothetical protein
VCSPCSGGLTSRVARPNTLNVDNLGSIESARGLTSPTALAGASSPLLPVAAKKPAVAGRRQGQVASSPTQSPTSTGLPPLKGAASVSASASGSQTSRGPRPRTVASTSATPSGAFTARVAAKDAAAASAAAATGDSDDGSDSEDDSGQANSVSVNAAAALYASLANGGGNRDSPGQASAAASSYNPTSPTNRLPAANAQALQSPSTASAASSFTFPQSSSSISAAAAASSDHSSPTPLAHASGGAGGGIAGEKDPTLKWAAVDSFAIATPKQKTGTVLVLAAYLARSASTPHVLDKTRAIYRWICENIVWVPPPQALANGSNGIDSSTSNRSGGESSGSALAAPATARARGMSEASAAAREAAKAAAEMKMEQSNKAGRMLPMLDDDLDDEEDIGDDMRTSGPGLSSPSSSSNSKQNSSNSNVDVLTDVSEILRRRRANSKGLSLLFQSLCDSAGIECVLIEGLGKGCGLIKVGERFDSMAGPDGQPAGNHWWNAFRLEKEGQWALIDVSWSAGYIHGGRLEKQFSGAYFRTNATIFALQHFPMRAYPPGATLPTQTPNANPTAGSILPARPRPISKAIAEFLKYPEKLQFLDIPSPNGIGIQKRCISKTQFEDAMMIERGYLDLGVQMLHPLGVHTVRHDTPLYTISLQAPNTLEFVVQLNIPNRPKSELALSTPGASGGAASRFVDQCWHVSYSALQDDPSQNRVDILFVFPWKGHYTCTIRARRFASKLFAYEDVIHYRMIASCGLFDIRKEAGVSCGFLAKRIVVGADHEFESKFALQRPLKGHFELGQSVKISVVAPAAVTRMVAVNNGRWIEMQSSPLGGNTSVHPLAGQPRRPTAPQLQIFEGDMKLQRYADIAINYKTKGQQFSQLYTYGLGSDSGSDSKEGVPSFSCLFLDDENKHGKVVLDSRGTCFEKRLHITALKLGKKSAALHFDTKAGTSVKAEVRSGWNSAVKVSDKITVNQTGSRAASEAQKCSCIAQPCAHTSGGAASYDMVSWEVATQLTEAGDYSIHLFLSSQGSGVYRFALVLYLRIGDKGAGFNLDVQ